MTDFIVFYAWQSDRREWLNRHLIRIALDMAAKSISDDAIVGIQVRIDSDTQGVLGHVPVTETILKKIVNCDAFVPDLTFVAETAGEKLICNPNVMLEYGYALKAKSYSVMMPVMNVAYGPAEKLPFDMGHLRHPLKYELPADATRAERRAVRKTLAGQFEEILRLMVAARVKPTSAELFTEAQVTSPGSLFKPGEVVAELGHVGEQAYRFEGRSVIYLRLFPKFGDQPKIGRTRLKTVMQRQALRPMSAKTSGGIVTSNDQGVVVLDALGSNLTQAYSQVLVSGEIWGANSSVFESVPVQNFRAPTLMRLCFAAIGVEKTYARALENYVSMALTEMGLRPPFVVEIGAVGLKEAYMATPDPEVSYRLHGPIRDDKLVRRYGLQSGADEEISTVLREFFDELYDLAECFRSDVLTDEHVNQNGLPGRS